MPSTIARFTRTRFARADRGINHVFRARGVTTPAARPHAARAYPARVHQNLDRFSRTLRGVQSRPPLQIHIGYAEAVPPPHAPQLFAQPGRRGWRRLSQLKSKHPRSTRVRAVYTELFGRTQNGNPGFFLSGTPPGSHAAIREEE